MRWILYEQGKADFTFLTEETINGIFLMGHKNDQAWFGCGTEKQIITDNDNVTGSRQDIRVWLCVLFF